MVSGCGFRFWCFDGLVVVYYLRCDWLWVCGRTCCLWFLVWWVWCRAVVLALLAGWLRGWCLVLVTCCVVRGCGWCGMVFSGLMWCLNGSRGVLWSSIFEWFLRGCGRMVAAVWFGIRVVVALCGLVPDSGLCGLL